MFMGPWDQGGPFQTAGLAGIWRWVQRVWSALLVEPTFGEASADGVGALRHATHAIVKAVSEDITTFSFNTMLARMMEFTTFLTRLRESSEPVDETTWKEARDSFILLLAPALPHLAEELWEQTGHAYSVHQQHWPTFDDALAAVEELTLVVQVDGKVRDRVQVPAQISEEQVRGLALASERVQQHLDGAEIERVVYVPGRLMNFVTTSAASD
jgi:leucyl-tRNA synthetase